MGEAPWMLAGGLRGVAAPPLTSSLHRRRCWPLIRPRLPRPASAAGSQAHGQPAHLLQGGGSSACGAGAQEGCQPVQGGDAAGACCCCCVATHQLPPQLPPLCLPRPGLCAPVWPDLACMLCACANLMKRQGCSAGWPAAAASRRKARRTACAMAAVNCALSQLHGQSCRAV